RGMVERRQVIANVSGHKKMPGCVLRVSGSKAKVRKFLSESQLRPSTISFKGDPGFPKSRGPVRVSGFNVPLTVSKLGESITKQCREAVSFIRKNQKEFERLKKYSFSNLTLDFGLNDIATEERPWPTYPLSAKLVELAGRYGLSIKLSFYGAP